MSFRELRGKQGWFLQPPSEYANEVKELMERDKFFIAEDEKGEALGFIRVSEKEGNWIEEIYVKPKRKVMVITVKEGRGVRQE